MIIQKKLKCPEESKKCESLVIRNISDKDKEEIMDILERSFPDVYPDQQHFWSDIIDINPSIAIDMNGKAVGISVIRTPSLISGKSVSWIDLFAIKPPYRRTGIGKKLLDESENTMKKLGAKKGKLWTGVDMTDAVSFYSKNDWKVSELTEWGYKDGHRLTMEKNI